jgi:hypothetical protein
MVIGRASHPDDPSRWALHLVPVDMKATCEACEVAQGIRKAGKRINTPATAPDALTTAIEGKAGTTLDTTA